VLKSWRGNEYKGLPGERRRLLSGKKGGYKFPPKGAQDNEPTPAPLYDILVKELGYKDVCLGPEKFDALKELWPNHSYCNPPYSIKALFVDAAVRSNEEGSEVLLYLPFDPSTGWFHKLYDRNPLIIFFLKPPKHARYPPMLIDLDFYPRPEVKFIWRLQELKDLLPPPPL